MVPYGSLTDEIVRLISVGSTTLCRCMYQGSGQNSPRHITVRLANCLLDSARSPRQIAPTGAHVSGVHHSGDDLHVEGCSRDK